MELMQKFDKMVDTVANEIVKFLNNNGIDITIQKFYDIVFYGGIGVIIGMLTVRAFG